MYAIGLDKEPNTKAYRPDLHPARYAHIIRAYDYDM